MMKAVAAKISYWRETLGGMMRLRLIPIALGLLVGLLTGAPSASASVVLAQDQFVKSQSESRNKAYSRKCKELARADGPRVRCKGRIQAWSEMYCNPRGSYGWDNLGVYRCTRDSSPGWAEGNRWIRVW